MNEDLLNYAFLAPLLASPYWGQFVLVQISIASSQISSTWWSPSNAMIYS
jgi:hypothetical protein